MRISRLHLLALRAAPRPPRCGTDGVCFKIACRFSEDVGLPYVNVRSPAEKTEAANLAECVLTRGTLHSSICSPGRRSVAPATVDRFRKWNFDRGKKNNKKAQEETGSAGRNNVVCHFNRLGAMYKHDIFIRTEGTKKTPRPANQEAPRLLTLRSVCSADAPRCRAGGRGKFESESRRSANCSDRSSDRSRLCRSGQQPFGVSDGSAAYH